MNVQLIKWYRRSTRCLWVPTNIKLDDIYIIETLYKLYFIVEVKVYFLLLLVLFLLEII